MKIYFAIAFFGVGLFLIFAALANWSQIHEDSAEGMRFYQELLGQNADRWVCGITGIVIIFYGIYILFE